MSLANRKSDGRDTRERLLLAAERLFSEKGFHGASLRDIGKEVGVANASLLYHFPSKGKLYGAVLERITEDFEDLGRRLDAMAGDAATKLKALSIEFYDWGMERPHYARIIMRELMDNVDRVERVEKWYLAPVLRKFQSIIDDGQEAGRFRRCDSVAYLLYVLGAVTFFSHGYPTFARVFERDDAELCQVFRAEAPDHALKGLLIPPKS